MKVYIAKCTTADPDIENGPSYTDILGIFSTKELAMRAFIRKEPRIDKDGNKWISEHICYEGAHEIKEYEVDEWFAFGK